MCVCVRLDDATSRPLTAISAAGHQRVPTGPNRPGQLASVTFARLLPVLSLFLFFLIFLPLLFSAISSCSFLFLRERARPFPLYPPLRHLLSSLTRPSLYIPAPHFVKIISRSRAIFQYLRKLMRLIFRNSARTRGKKSLLVLKLVRIKLIAKIGYLSRANSFSLSDFN